MLSLSTSTWRRPRNSATTIARPTATSAAHKYLRELEAVIIAVCARFGVTARRQESLTGVWVQDRKIASIGVGVRKWISMHGFALNVCGKLEGFSQITPCGLTGVTITSLEREGASDVTVEGAAEVAAEEFRGSLSLNL